MSNSKRVNVRVDDCLTLEEFEHVFTKGYLKDNLHAVVRKVFDRLMNKIEANDIPFVFVPNLTSDDDMFNELMNDFPKLLQYHVDSPGHFTTVVMYPKGNGRMTPFIGVGKRSTYKKRFDRFNQNTGLINAFDGAVKDFFIRMLIKRGYIEKGRVKN